MSTRFSSVHDFLSLLNGVQQRNSNEWAAHCPCRANHSHNDKNRSLFVSFDATKHNILVYCQTGCSTDAVCAALGCTTADLFLSSGNGSALDNFIAWAKSKGLTNAVPYSYCYGQFTDGLHKVRFTGNDGKKTFLWFHPDPTGKNLWLAKHDGCPHRLFIDGNPLDEQYAMAEGEKDAQTLHRLLGITAVSSENGATHAEQPGKKWLSEYNEQLKGKTIFLFYDNDEDGIAFRDIEIKEISKTARRLFVIDISKIWPDIPHHADVSDFVSAMGDDKALSLLRELMESTPETTPETQKTLQKEFSAQDATLTAKPDPAPQAEPQKELQPAAPAWIIGNAINEMEFAKYFIAKTGWQKTGRVIRTSDNQIITNDAARKAIATEISSLFPTDTQRKVNQLFRLILLYLPDAKPADEFVIKSAWELSQEKLSPPAFIVNSILPVGLTVFAAAPKTGKSWLCLALADAIAAGTKFMGFDVQRGSCLYAALEDSKFRVVDRLKKIGSDMPKSLQIVNSGAKRLDDGLLLQLETWIDKTPDAKLIVIDTLARVRPSSASGLDAYQQDTLTIAPLQAMALNRGVAVIVVTHYSKSKQFTADADPFDRITGSNGLFGVADAAWLIYGKRGGSELTFRTTGRDSMDNEFKITFNKETCRWLLLGTSEAIEEQRKNDEYKSNPIARTIKTVLKEKGRWEVTASELILEVARRTQSYIGDAREVGAKLAGLTDLLLADGIIMTKAPGGRRGRGYSFETTERFF